MSRGAIQRKIESELRKLRPSRLSKKRAKLMAENAEKKSFDSCRSDHHFIEVLKGAPEKPVALPVTTETGTVWSALHEIGRQLQKLAAAHMGQGTFRVQTSFPPAYVPDSPTVVELVNQFLLTKARAGKSDRYIRALRNSLGKFVVGRANKFIHDITVADCEQFMQNSEWSPRTQCGYIGDIRTLFNFAVKRGLLKTNPAAGVELPTVEADAVEIYTPDEARKILNFARGYDLNICRALAVRFFAGLRSIETDRMVEQFIGAKYVEVTAATSKGARARRRRLVTIQPNLREWFKLGGELPVKGNKSNVWRDFTTAMTRATGIPWRHNATRHSFCSYHLAKFRNAGRTAMEAGHSEPMLFGHYREIVTPEAAAEYFSILPD